RAAAERPATGRLPWVTGSHGWVVDQRPGAQGHLVRLRVPLVFTFPVHEYSPSSVKGAVMRAWKSQRLTRPPGSGELIACRLFPSNLPSMAPPCVTHPTPN